MSRHRAPSAPSRALTAVGLTGIVLGLSLGAVTTPAVASPGIGTAPQADVDLDGKDKQWDKPKHHSQPKRAKAEREQPRKASSRADNKPTDDKRSDDKSTDSKSTDSKSTDSKSTDSKSRQQSRPGPEPRDNVPAAPDPASYLTPKPQKYKPDPDAPTNPYYKDYGAPYNPHRH